LVVAVLVVGVLLTRWQLPKLAFPTEGAELAPSLGEVSVDEGRPSHEFTVCLQEKRTSGKPITDGGSMECQREVSPKPAWGNQGSFK